MELLYKVIMVITTLVIGLGLLSPLAGMVLEAQTGWNCDADAYSKLVCTISDFWIIFFVLGLFMFIGAIYYKKKQNTYDDGGYGPEDYSAYGPSASPYQQY